MKVVLNILHMGFVPNEVVILLFKGIYQRKDGLYSARFVDKAGKRHEKYFQTLPEARNWIEDAKYADKHDDVFVATDTTVDEWFNF